MSKRELEWDDAAIRRLKKAPFFIRKLARGKIEKAAREQGVDRITVEFVDSIKNREMTR